jgi:GAF domain-containing protein
MSDHTHEDQRTAATELATLAAAFAELRARTAVGGPHDDALNGLVDVALTRVPGTRWASITVQQADRFRTAVWSDERALAADRIQYELRSGPCVDASAEDAVYHPEDLRTDPRWPDFGRRVADELGMRSMLAVRLATDGGALRGALNLYSDQPVAFDEQSRTMALLLATHASAVVETARQTDRSNNLERALETSREIGIGIGVLMALHKIPRDAAFDLLRIASQSTHRKLRDLAIEVARTGVLPSRATQQAGRDANAGR